jgi:hypothetical protein
MASKPLKTQPTTAGIADAGRREECLRLLALMERVSGEPARMWGPAMVGFGRYRYVYESGREGEWFRLGFSPRKQALTVYVMSGFADQTELMSRLGKHTTGKSCLYLKRLSDVDIDALEALLRASLTTLRQRYG